MNKQIKFGKVLTIAGFDGSGGAGMQADLKVMSALGCYAMTVLTVLVAQNTVRYTSFHEIPLKVIEEQLNIIFEDIPPDVIKIGMLGSGEVVKLVAGFLDKNAKGIPIILDPVMVCKNGKRLLEYGAIDALKERLIPLARIVTPNALEAVEIVRKSRDGGENLPIVSIETMPEIATEILKFGAQSVFLKGGHSAEENISADFYLNRAGESKWFKSNRIDTENTHGTGCTLSAAIASAIALGKSELEACRIAKIYTHNAIDAAKNCKIGHGFGPVQHFYHLWPTMDRIDEDGEGVSRN